MKRWSRQISNQQQTQFCNKAMKIRRNLFSRLYRDPEPGVDGGGAPTDDTHADPSATSTETAPPANSIEGGMAAMFPTAAAAPENETPEAKAERLRDEAGRFAKKVEPDPKAPPAAAVDPKKPATDPKDANAMPEGLTPKAQERFQALANTNKELTGRLEQLTALTGGNPDAVAPLLQSAVAMAQTFQENGVSREQFDRATHAIGLLNRGDMAGFQQLLEDQLRQVALHTGRAPGQIDALAGFADLREAVDNLQMTEAHAIEVARSRAQQQYQQQTQQQQQREQEREQTSQREFQNGVMAVEKFTRERMTTDLDYAKIEPILQKKIKDGLLAGVPPSAYRSIVEKTYELIKETSTMSRPQSSGGGVLRPSGGDAVKGKPQSGFEAMFGTPAPAGYRE